MDKKLPKGSELKDPLVYFDADTAMIRLKTRLHRASSLTFDYSNPIIIPRSELAKTLVLEVHVKRFHVSRELLLMFCANIIGSVAGFVMLKI